MRLSRFGFIISLCTTMFAFAATAIAHASSALDRFGRLMLDAIAPAGKPFALAGMPTAPISISGVALARSTQNGLRHEASTSRRAAPRNV